jgi:hypothetical protein
MQVGDDQDRGLQKRIEAGLISAERLQGMEETRKEGANPEHFAPFIAYLASDGATGINGCIFVGSRATIGIWNHPNVVRTFTRSWEIEDPWGFEELEKRVPEELLVDYVNPAPRKDD